MIISQTPHRISFFGGGTDYPAYYLKHGGKTLGAAIDKYSYLNIRKLPPFFEHKHRIVYSKQENVSTFDEIVHPAVKAVLTYLNPDYGVSIHHDGDIPARSGMGSSSSFTAGLLKGMLALEGNYISSRELAEKTIHIEQELIKEDVGSQDQVFAAFGGFNIIEFLKNGEFTVTPMILSSERLADFESHLMLFYTGISRIAADVAKAQIENTETNTDALNKMKKYVDDATEILSSDADLKEFGMLLNDNWQLKQSLSDRITTPEADDLYNRAIKAGAIGGKLLGAGGGGFMLIFAEPEKQSNVRKELSDYLHVPFEFDFEGSKIVIYRPEESA
ncbi:MAG: GHMP family kinase ATP-binding protein [Planctomycetota bacterium]|jgi:D-glycero-alpha-D-manno-heptose-7-phosphate kinase